MYFRKNGFKIPKQKKIYLDSFLNNKNIFLEMIVKAQIFI